MNSQTTETEIPLMEAARRAKLSREQMLLRGLQQGTAVQRRGRWHILVSGETATTQEHNEATVALRRQGRRSAER